MILETEEINKILKRIVFYLLEYKLLLVLVLVLVLYYLWIRVRVLIDINSRLICIYITFI